MFCSKCGSQQPDDSKFCMSCGASIPGIGGGQTVIIQQRSQTHGMPALLSFFIPGLGQIVRGDVGKGIAIFVVWCMTVAASFVLIGIPFMIALWVWQIYDAYN